MLDPEDRLLLGDLLAPPDGYVLDHALATTFTLDLTALLTVPLGFAGADLASGTNELEIIRAVHEYAGKIDVFCQGGAIKVPNKPNSLLAFLEPIIHPVRPSLVGHIFHPKIWLLRFSSSDEVEMKLQKFRLICGSRNLTFDRSWDSAIVLDGEEKRTRFAYNNPLCAFLSKLPDRAGGLTEDRQLRLEETVSRLHNVEWERPEGAVESNDWLSFHIFGNGKSPKPNLWGKQVLIISPFINTRGLEMFSECESIHVLSRPEQLDALDLDGRELLSRNREGVFTIHDEAALRDVEDEETGVRWELTGLHSKTYVFDRGHYAHVLVGSANATEAGWMGNDEILVEIVGRKKNYGVETMLGEKAGLRKILVEHTFGEETEVDPDDDIRRLLESALRGIAAIDFVANVSGSDDGGWEIVVSTFNQVSVAIAEAKIEISLATRVEEKQNLVIGNVVNSRWKLGRLEDVTPFVLLTMSYKNIQVSTVILAKLIGAPENRVDRILAQHLSNPEKFLQFIAMLLALAGGGSTSSTMELVGQFGFGSIGWSIEGAGLFETLLKALSRSPEVIDEVGGLVVRLRSTPQGREILPEGWDELWESISDARNQLGGSK